MKLLILTNLRIEIDKEIYDVINEFDCEDANVFFVIFNATTVARLSDFFFAKSFIII